MRRMKGRTLVLGRKSTNANGNTGKGSGTFHHFKKFESGLFLANVASKVRGSVALLSIAAFGDVVIGVGRVWAAAT